MKMTDFVHTLQLRLSEENINFGNDVDSILSFLCNAYYDHNCSHESDEIKRAYEDLYEAMNGKTIREMDEIIYPCSGRAKIAALRSERNDQSWSRRNRQQPG